MIQSMDSLGRPAGPWAGLCWAAGIKNEGVRIDSDALACLLSG